MTTSREQIEVLERDLRTAKASGAPEDYIDMIRGEIVHLYMMEVVQ